MPVMLTAVRRRIERWGRDALVALVGLLLGPERRAVVLGPRPRILVVRLDERVGNLVLTSPILSSLRLRFPQAQIDLLAHHRGASLMARHPALSHFLVFDKRRLLAKHGPLATPWVLRRQRYDVAIDAANPSDPSTTQALLVRLCGATHTVGYAEGRFARLYTAPVVSTSVRPHEIDMRLALLQALPGAALERHTSLAELAVSKHGRPRPYGIINVGARLGEKRLGPGAYGALAQRLLRHGLDCVVVYGPSEWALAKSVVAAAPGAELAPPTSLVELAQLTKHARVVLTCDTGPMHIAVALGAPTCGLFVSTEPTRYGYTESPHAAIDTRARDPSQWLADVDAWLQARLNRVA